MVGLYSGDPIDSSALESEGVGAIPATAGQVAGAAAGSAFAGGPGVRLARMIGSEGAAAPDETGFGYQPPAEPTDQLSPDDANARFGIAGTDKDHSLSFTSSVPEAVARDLWEHKRAQNLRDDTISRSQGGLLAGAPARLVYGLAGGLLDPLNVAASFVPVIGEANAERLIAAAGSGVVGRTAGRAAVGAIQGAGGAALLEPLQALEDARDQETWSPITALRDIAFGGALGGLVHAAGGLAGEAFDRRPLVRGAMEDAGRPVIDPAVQEPVLRGAVAGLAEDAPMPVQSLLDLQSDAAPAAPFERPAPANVETSPMFTGAGQRVDVRPEAVELFSLISSHQADGTPNPDFPDELQPRDRSTAASLAQIQSIAGNLEPQRLTVGTDASAGAPVVGPDNVVESGNGRIAALGQVYASTALKEKADAYRAMIADQGFDVSTMEKPVLIARRVTDLTPEQRKAFTLGANERTTLAMSAAERARADQARVSKALDLWRGGDVDGAANRDFVRAFMAQLSPEERGSMILPNGSLSAEGVRRIQSAVLAHAYGDELGPTLDRFLNADAEGMKNIAGALSDVAGGWSIMRRAAERGEIRAAMDVTRDLAAAVETVERARRGGFRVRDIAGQADLDREPLSPNGARLLSAFFRDDQLSRPAGRSAVAEALDRYATEALKATPGPDLFGAEPPSAATTLETAVRAVQTKPAAALTDLISMSRRVANEDRAESPRAEPPPADPLAAVQKQVADLQAALAPQLEPAPRERIGEPVKEPELPPELKAAQDLEARAERRASAFAQAGACLVGKGA